MVVLVSGRHHHHHRRCRRQGRERGSGRKRVAYGRVTKVALGDGLEERGLADVCQSNLESASRTVSAGLGRWSLT